MKKIFSFVAIFSICLSMSTANADVIEIDTFSAGNLLQQFGPGTNTQTTSDMASILGGERDETITVRDLNGDESFGLFSYPSGEWNVAQGSRDQIFGGLTYDNFTDFDFTDGGDNVRFGLDVTQTDNPTDPISGVLELVVESNGIVEAVGFDLPADDTLPQNVYVQFDEFSNIDFTQVDSVSINFDFASDPGRDFRITRFIATVPEPTSAVVVLGMLGGLCMRRRRQA